MATKVFSEVASTLRAQVFQSQASLLKVTVVGQTLDNSQSFSATTNTAFSFGNTQTVLQYSKLTLTVLTVNSVKASAKLQISPDATHWADDNGSLVRSISQSAFYVFAPTENTKYARIAVEAASGTVVRVFAQGA